MVKPRIFVRVFHEFVVLAVSLFIICSADNSVGDLEPYLMVF